MDTNTTTSEAPRITPTGCCPPFDPATWNERDVIWQGRPFVKERVRSFLHVPIGFGRKVAHAQARIQAAGAQTPQNLMLSDDASPWHSDLYIDVTRPVPGAEMTTLSGEFLTKVYDGPFRDAPKWAEDMKQYVESKHRRLEKLYFAYTTCPSCAKAYGHNYVVLFAQVDGERN